MLLTVSRSLTLILTLVLTSGLSFRKKSPEHILYYLKIRCIDISWGCILFMGHCDHDLWPQLLEEKSDLGPHRLLEAGLADSTVDDI